MALLETYFYQFNTIMSTGLKQIQFKEYHNVLFALMFISPEPLRFQAQHEEMVA